MKKLLPTIFLGLFTPFLAPEAAGDLVNGNFETGTFAGWTLVDQAGGSGSFFLDTPGTTTPNGVFTTAANPSGGSFYAVTSQGGGGAHALLQSFTILPGQTSITLAFQMFVVTTAAASTPASLNYTVVPNQQARVDILSSTALPFDITTGVVANLYTGKDPGAAPVPYTNYSFDLSGILTPGTYFLRFAEADNQNFLSMGVDNVTLTAVPEPSTIATGALLAGWAGMSLLRRFRASKAGAVALA